MENVLTAEGTGLVTALRVLNHIACPPPAVEGEDIEHDFCTRSAVKKLYFSFTFRFLEY